jgi:hypothetical protein
VAGSPQPQPTATAFATVAATPSPVASPVALLTTSVITPCEFKLGFAKVHDLAPDIVGDCRENEVEVLSGMQQRTTKGILVYTRQNDWVAFNNDSDTWFLKSCKDTLYLARRSNTERFPDEDNPDKLRRVDYPACP